MNRLELEKKLNERAKEIGESGLVSKCYTLPHHLGKCLFQSEEWCSSNYVWENGNLKVDAYTFAMGDQKIQVDFKEEIVFQAKEWINNCPTNGNPTIIDSNRTYELLIYKKGEWRNIIEDTYKKLMTKVPDEEIKRITSRIELPSHHRIN